jgi:hypothetical protein
MPVVTPFLSNFPVRGDLCLSQSLRAISRAKMAPWPNSASRSKAQIHLSAEFIT